MCNVCHAIKWHERMMWQARLWLCWTVRLATVSHSVWLFHRIYFTAQCFEVLYLMCACVCAQHSTNQLSPFTRPDQTLSLPGVSPSMPSGNVLVHGRWLDWTWDGVVDPRRYFGWQRWWGLSTSRRVGKSVWSRLVMYSLYMVSAPLAHQFLKRSSVLCFFLFCVFVGNLLVRGSDYPFQCHHSARTSLGTPYGETSDSASLLLRFWSSITKRQSAFCDKNHQSSIFSIVHSVKINKGFDTWNDLTEVWPFMQDSFNQFTGPTPVDAAGH